MEIKNQTAFTLTEVLLAVAIVGIIAALVLPMVSTHYQNELYNHAYKREIDTIESAVEGLSVNENKANFFDTMMYTSSEPEDYKESSEKFLRKYVKTTKICSEAKDCFAQEYYEYTKDEQNRNVKKEYKPEYKGSCGILKNGMSMCITPQIGGEGIHGIIDLNGKKGPNVHNRDLREFSLSSRTRVGLDTTTDVVRSLDWENMGEEDPVDPCEGLTCGCGSLPDCEENPCSVSTTSLGCCELKPWIDSASDPCCTYDEIKNKFEACQTTQCMSAEISVTPHDTGNPNAKQVDLYLTVHKSPANFRYQVCLDGGYCQIFAATPTASKNYWEVSGEDKRSFFVTGNVQSGQTSYITFKSLTQDLPVGELTYTFDYIGGQTVKTINNNEKGYCYVINDSGQFLYWK